MQHDSISSNSYFKIFEIQFFSSYLCFFYIHISNINKSTSYKMVRYLIWIWSLYMEWPTDKKYFFVFLMFGWFPRLYWQKPRLYFEHFLNKFWNLCEIPLSRVLQRFLEGEPCGFHEKTLLPPPSLIIQFNHCEG